MKIRELCCVLNAKELNIADGEKEISTGYAGDLLSYVMGKAPTGCAWFTIMTNVNVCAVATLADVSVVVICDNSEPDEQLLKRVKEQDINLISTALDEYGAIAAFVSSNEN